MKTSSCFLVVVSAFLLVALVVQGLVPYHADGGEGKEPKRAVLDRHEVAISQINQSLTKLKAEVRSLRTTVGRLNIRLSQVNNTVKNMQADIASPEEQNKGKDKKDIRKK